MNGLLKRISLFLLLAMSLSACEEDNVPRLDKTGIEKEELLGGWKVATTRTHINVDPKWQLQVAAHDLKGKLNDAFDERAENGSLYFRKDMVFFLRNGFVKDSSRYRIEEKYIIQYENTHLIGFYAPKMYVKMNDDGQLVLFLRRSETIDLLNEDGSLDKFMSLIRDVVDDAQCEIYFDRDYDEFYDELEAMGRE